MHQLPKVMLAGAALGVLPSISATQAEVSAVCQQLWVERNSYYKAHGYCFKTSRAIEFFGNAGCMYEKEEALRFSPAEQKRIADIMREERRNGC
jgi:hypothetical protein